MADIIAETQRLILRTIDEPDAAEQYRVLNTPAVMARLGGPKELHEIEAKHAKAMQWYAQRGFSFLMLIEKESGELVGHAGIKLVDNPLAKNQGDHEIGWLIREDRWRRGYAEEAVRAVLEWAFTRVDAPHVVALTSEANVASWKLMKKLGMVRREDLDFEDPEYPPEDNPVIQYSLTKDQWEHAQ
ncbi:GNAT family N-acetyltransferase [Qipengyuania sp. 1NDH17]|uniref:GNAT family N-acetyltransferase n=1 Tax=Qipengyuania polymorpha TaxID=2867234 RepID=A0ABS7IYX4_9SPHN|nr:GNAT family N-acetyltransferase [Qipengyuania polymorpha]MBX7458766.1 GNAT family N-acetyltransferase [Qipengyuania polymorpha]